MGKTKTKIGATAFKALTNKLPNIENDLAISGVISAKTIPRTMAIIIWFTMLIDFSLPKSDGFSKEVFSVVIVYLI